MKKILLFLLLFVGCNSFKFQPGDHVRIKINDKEGIVRKCLPGAALDSGEYEVRWIDAGVIYTNNFFEFELTPNAYKSDAITIQANAP